MAINPALLAPGVKAPTWTTNLVRPAGRPNALWAGANNPGAGWTGVGAGWWVPPKSSVGTAASTTRTTTPVQTPGTSATTTAAPAPAATPPPAPSPLDARYWQNVTQNDQTTTDKIAGYQNQETQADTALSTALAAYAKQQPLDVLAAQIAANRTGGLTSGSMLGKIGNIGYAYTQRGNAALTTRDNAISNLATLIAGAQDAGSAYDTGEYWNAVGRAANAAASDTSLGATAPAGSTTPAASRPAAPTHVRPAGAPANARWAGPNRPGPNWRGIGGGWWVPK